MVWVTRETRFPPWQRPQMSSCLKAYRSRGWCTGRLVLSTRKNALVEASIKSADSANWADEMADSLKAELAAAEAVKAGDGPWLTLSASYAHKAGTLFSSSRDPTSSSSSARAKKPSHLPPPPRSAPVGEPVSVMVVLENLLTVAVSVEDMQLVLTTPGSRAGVGEDEVACLALDKDEFENMCSLSPSNAEADTQAGVFSSTVPTPAGHSDAGADAGTGACADGGASVAIERRSATIPPGERLPVLLKFIPLRPAATMLIASAVKWRIFQRNGSKEASGVEPRMGENCSRVWVSHRLEGRGQLLHATREQRAAKARAPAPPPRFEAKGPMPWLGCMLEGVPPTLLQGEVIRATLKVTNRGRAPAGSLCLKTSLPWVAFESPVAAEASREAAGGAVGASGTTLIPPVGVIMPGESVALPLWLRGRGGGRQTVRMVVRYKRGLIPLSQEGSSTSRGPEGESGEAATDDPLFSLERYAPLWVEMCVLPSLSVAASVLPSYSRRGEYVLSLEATNYRSNGDELPGTKNLRVHKVCSISRCWQMEPLAGLPSEEKVVRSDTGEESGTKDGGAIVRWQERITLHYRLFPAEGSDGQNQAGSADSPHLPLLCLEQAASNYYLACRKHRQQTLAEEQAAENEQPKSIQGVRKERERDRALEALKKEKEDEQRRWLTQRRAHPTSPGALCAPDVSLVHLMVLWGLDGDGEDRDRVGQHHVRSLVIRPERVDRQCPLVLTVKYPSQVCWRENSHKQHEGQECGNGNGGNGCDAEVTVCATNRLAGPRDRAKVNFTFEVRSDDGPRRLSTIPGAPAASGSGGMGQGSNAKRPPRNRFVWLGPAKRRVVGLGPGEATTIPLKVRFLRPGVFDLNRFRFVVEFAPPTTAVATADGRGKSSPSASPPHPQHRESPASQHGRVTFVFPAQYLVTVAPQS